MIYRITEKKRIAVNRTIAVKADKLLQKQIGLNTHIGVILLVKPGTVWFCLAVL
jgi:hypothetical protein